MVSLHLELDFPFSIQMQERETKEEEWIRAGNQFQVPCQHTQLIGFPNE